MFIRTSNKTMNAIRYIASRIVIWLPRSTADPGGGGARERAHPRLRKFFNVQTIFKHVSMCVRNLLGACIDASAAVQRLCISCPRPSACVVSPCTFHM